MALRLKNELKTELSCLDSLVGKCAAPLSQGQAVRIQFKPEFSQVLVFQLLSRYLHFDGRRQFWIYFLSKFSLEIIFYREQEKLL